MQNAEKKPSHFCKRSWKVMEETAQAGLLICSSRAALGLILGFEEESPAGWWVEEHIPPCPAGGKGSREQQAMDGEANLMEGPIPGSSPAETRPEGLVQAGLDGCGPGLAPVHLFPLR